MFIIRYVYTNDVWSIPVQTNKDVCLGFQKWMTTVNTENLITRRIHYN